MVLVEIYINRFKLTMVILPTENQKQKQNKKQFRPTLASGVELMKKR